MKLLIYILFLLSPTIVLCQDYTDKNYYLIDELDIKSFTESDKILLDSCISNYHSTKNDTTKVRILINMCENMMNDHWKEYQFFTLNLIDSLQNKNQSKEYHEFYMNNKAICYGNIGVIYDDKGDIPKALDYYYKALKIFEENGNKYYEANMNTNIGYVYNMQGDNIKGIDYYKRALAIHKEVDNKSGLAISLNNIGAVYKDLNKLDSALKYANLSLEVSLLIDYKQNAAYAYGHIGGIYQLKEQYDLAQNYFLKSLKIREEIGDIKGVVNSLSTLSKLTFAIGKFNSSKKYAEKMLEKSKKINYSLGIKSASKTLHNVYIKQNRYYDALKMYKLHIKISDSLNNEATQKAAIQQQAKYEYEKQKAIDDAEHEKEIAIEQEAKEKQTILTYATGGGLGLVGIFLLIVFNRLKVTRKQKNIIEEQKQEVEYQKEVVEKAHTQLEEKNKEITDSIQYAKRIQNAILPPNKVVKEYLTESFILYKPKDIVAGDFYWLEQKDDKVLFAAADCTGHGVPGAMVSVVCNNGLNRSVREYNLTDPGKILDKTREIVVKEFEKSEEEVKDGMDIALCSLEGNKLQYAGANNPLWIIRKGELLETKANKQPIGKFDNPEPYTTHTIELQKGDSIYIFSDGYADQFGGEKGKKLKTANFKKFLLTIQNENMQKQKELIDEAFESWKGDLEQLDDVCVIGVNI